ncbi:hypothetical protein [Rhizobium sp. Rhizsp42]|uniref:hypothetical protein n=1 Tax=Rhizobium sp. Rhizsp42 TaxID=3243034 RepID=UPI0039AEA417
MKTHFYPFTGQAMPVPSNILQALGVPATTVAELMRIGVIPTTGLSVKGGRRG